MIDIYEFMTWTKEERQAHLDLDSPCEFRGTSSVECRALLAANLGTSVPRGWKVHCCHACHDGACSNWRHLYWGTAGENIQDAIDNGTHPGLSRPGQSNGNYQLAPWRNVNKKSLEWSWAQDIYEYYTSNELDFTAWGKGHLFLMSRFSLSQGPAKSMIRKFREGWVPIEDPEWLEDFEVEQYGIGR